MGEAQRLAAAWAVDELDWSDADALAAARSWFGADDDRFDQDGVKAFVEVLEDFSRGGFANAEIGLWLGLTGVPALAQFYKSLGFTAQQALDAAPLLAHSPTGRPDAGQGWREWETFVSSMPPEFVAAAAKSGVSTPAEVTGVFAQYEREPEQVMQMLQVLGGLR